MSLSLFVHLPPPAADAVKAGGEHVDAAAPQEPGVTAVCAARGWPWPQRRVLVHAVRGEAPPELRPPGSVRLELDVEWILQELKFAGPAPLLDELLALMADRGDSRFDPAARRFVVLAGRSPAERAARLGALIDVVGPVQAVLARPLDDGDVDHYATEPTPLAVL